MSGGDNSLLGRGEGQGDTEHDGRLREESQQAALELLGPLERVLMGSLLDLGWKVWIDPRKNISGGAPKLSFISPTNQVFDAWEEVTHFFGETGKQEGWYPNGSEEPKNGKLEIVDAQSAGGVVLEDMEAPKLGFQQEDGPSQDALDERGGGGLLDSGKKSTAVSSHLSANEGSEPKQAEPVRPELNENWGDSQEALQIAAQLARGEASPSALMSLLDSPLFSVEAKQNSQPVAAAKRTPLPPPAPNGIVPPVFDLQAPASEQTGEGHMPAGHEPADEERESHSDDPQSRGGFVYDRKDGVKVYHRAACKCRGCTAKRKNGEVPDGSPEASTSLIISNGLVLHSETSTPELLPWELGGGAMQASRSTVPLDNLQPTETQDDPATAIAAAMAALGVEAQGMFQGAPFQGTLNSLDVEEEYLTADESPHGSGREVSLEGGLGGTYENEEDAAFWQARETQQEAEEEYESEVEDLDLFLPRIMEQTGFTPTLPGFAGFGPSAYAAMQATAYEDDQPAYEREESPVREQESRQLEPLSPDGLGSRKRNVYLCKRCGQIKKGHKCNPEALQSSLQHSQSKTLTPTPVLEAPPKPVEPPKTVTPSFGLQPYSFSSLSRTAPPLLNDLQSFFSSPRQEGPPKPNAPNSTSELRPHIGLIQNIGYKPSKAASATAIQAAQSNSAHRMRSPSVVIPAYEVPPTNARLLLATGLVEGQHVSYIMQSGKLLLTGWIQGGGVICECEKCRGKALISLSEFEKHAGSVARHPSDYIFLDDGRNLRQLVEDAQAVAAGKMLPSQHLIRWESNEAAPGGAMALAPAVECACSACGEEGNVLKCSQCQREYHAECVGLERPPSASAHWTCPRCQGGGGHGIYRGPPIARLLKQSPAVFRKRTPSNVFNLLFTENGLPDGEAVSYRIRGETILVGKKARGGIICSCCNAVVSPSTFEQHAGKGSRRNPYTSIFVDSADVHLKEYAQSRVDMSRVNRDEAEPEECAECGDGGNLILCDGCPKAYHPECVRLSAVPKGDWFCGSCNKPQAAAAKTKAVAQKEKEKGQEEGASDLLARCQRLLTEVDTTTGGCILCRMQDFSKTFGDRTIILCDQCEREFHVGCLRQHKIADLNELPEGDWFCGGECERIYETLQGFVEKGQHQIPEYQIRGGKAAGDGRQRTWQLLKGRQGSADNGKVLAAAVDILSKCFDPIIDGASGEDLLPMMVHSRQTKDHDFSGMYCLALRSGNKVASVAVIRVFGNKLAEMPLIATSLDARRQGHCRALMTATEWLLATLGVDRLSLPAAEGAEETWQTGFGFTKMADSDLQKWRAELQALLVFPGASMLEKAIPPLPGMAKPQPSPPSMHPRQLTGQALQITEGQEGGAISKGKRSKKNRTGQGTTSTSEGPAVSALSAEEEGSEAPILIKFSRKKDTISSDSTRPIAASVSVHADAETPGKKKRGRPLKVRDEDIPLEQRKRKRGRPLKPSAEAEGRPAESDNESVDLDVDGMSADKQKSGGERSSEGQIENEAGVSPIQLQRKALQHTKPRSNLGRTSTKETEAETEQQDKPLTIEDKRRKFAEGVAKGKEKKRKREDGARKAGEAKRAKKEGGDETAQKEGGENERKETSSRSANGLKGFRSKRRPRVFHNGGEFWLQMKPGGAKEREGKVNLETDGKRPAKKAKLGGGLGENEIKEAGMKAKLAKGGGGIETNEGKIAESRPQAEDKQEALVDMGGIAQNSGRKRKGKSKRRKEGDQESAAAVEGVQNDGGTSIRMLSKSLEPHKDNQKTAPTQEAVAETKEQREESGEEAVAKRWLNPNRKGGRFVKAAHASRQGVVEGAHEKEDAKEMLEHANDLSPRGEKTDVAAPVVEAKGDGKKRKRKGKKKSARSEKPSSEVTERVELLDTGAQVLDQGGQQVEKETDASKGKGQQADKESNVVDGKSLQVYQRRKVKRAKSKEPELVFVADPPLVEVSKPVEEEAAQGKHEGKTKKASGKIVKGVKGFQKKHQAVGKGTEVVADLAPESAGGDVDAEGESTRSGLIVKGVKGFQRNKNASAPAVDGSANDIEAAQSKGTRAEQHTRAEEGLTEEAQNGVAVLAENGSPGPLQGFRKAGRKGKKKKRKGARATNVTDAAAIEGERGHGKEEERVDLTEQKEPNGVSKHDGESGESLPEALENEDMEGKAADASLPFENSKKVRVSRELQALQGASKSAGGSFERSKTADNGTVFLGFVSSTRQRVR